MTPCVQIQGRYGAAVHSLILSQGLRGLQQSAATLTGSLKLIGFDIKNYHKQHFQKINTRRQGTRMLYERVTPSLLFFSLSSLYLLFFHP